MSNLRDTAQAVIDRWDTPLWKDVPATAVFIHALRDALADEPTIKESKMVGPYLLNGMRHKVTHLHNVGYCIHGLPQELNGKWVAFVAADDNCHLKPEPTGERAELIKRLRGYSLRSGYAIHCHKAADMLEADGRVPLTDARVQAAIEYADTRWADTNDAWESWQASRKVALEDVAKFIEDGSFLHDTSPAKLFANQLAPKVRNLG